LLSSLLCSAAHELLDDIGVTVCLVELSFSLSVAMSAIAMFDQQAQGYKPLWLTIIDYSTAVVLCLGILLSLSFNLFTWVHKESGGYVKLQLDSLASASAKEAFSSRLLANIEDLGDEDGDPVDVQAFWSTVRRPFHCYMTAPGLLEPDRIGTMWQTPSLHPCDCCHHASRVSSTQFSGS
jgi:hypothetical protein